MTTSIAEYSATDAALAELRTRYEAVVYDVTNGKGMAEAKKARAEIRDYRVTLEKTRVEIKAPALERCRQIDSEAKRITAELEALEAPIDRQIKAEEQRKANEKAEAERIERERVAAINARFDAIKAFPQRAIGRSSDEVEALIAEAEATDMEFPADLRAAAEYELRAALGGLRTEHAKAVKREADAAELERLRAIEAELQRERDRLAEVERQRVADEHARAKAAEDIARAERQAEEAREAARIAAEQAEIRQAEAVKAAEEKARRDAEQAEQARRDAESRAAAEKQAEDERRAANQAHRRKINNAAKAALLAAGLSDEQAQAVIVLIASGDVPHVSIRY